MATQEAVSVMLFAKALGPYWGLDKRYWRWPFIKESPTSNTLIEMAELIRVCWLEIDVALDTSYLTEGTIYEVSFVVMLKKDASGWDFPVTLDMEEPNGKKSQCKVNMKDLPREEWIEIRVGDFTNQKKGELKFFLSGYEGGLWKTGLIVKGASIKPQKSFPI
ncbi:hypothetical protein Scep_022248 [Stephania cephalantha]|uniref:Phloem protein 2 n=1 Tax=Stephania cephalantha TaxID=152367 RepID=A0AAP0I2I5_9MAGN